MKVGKTKYRLDGKEVTKAVFMRAMKARGKAEGVPFTSRAWEQPQACEALGVQPDHVKFERQLDAEAGLNVNYTPDGRPVFTSRRERNAYIRAKGYYDRNAGYGDVSPLNR